MTLTRVPTAEFGLAVTDSAMNPQRRYLSQHRKPVELAEKTLRQKSRG